MGSKNRGGPLGIFCCLSLLLTGLLLVGGGVSPSAAADTCDACVACHGDFAQIHKNANHTAAPGSGTVVLFANVDHAGDGSVGNYGVTVDCTVCHNTDLPPIHGNDCSTCHPTPFDSLGGTWSGGCQQGGCHSSYHSDANKAHSPFENSGNYAGNDCSRCHNVTTWAVTQSKCLSCHAAPGSGYTTPPVTTASFLATYIGPAKIDFSITANGKVGLGRTFYKLDGGSDTAAAKSLLVTAPGSHTLEFWSLDQYGNAEVSHHNASFTIVADTTPPVTTSNAQATYSNGAVITLNATDASTLGVKATYYRINSGVTQSGTTVVIPPPSATTSYTLTFWSEDWSGNVETAKTATFTVYGGQGTIRMVWGDSDVSGSPCPGDPDAWISWTIRRDAGWGPIVASGSAGCPNWSGVVNAVFQPGPAAYVVIIDWWSTYVPDGDETVFQNIHVTTGGQVVRLSY